MILEDIKQWNALFFVILQPNTNHGLLRGEWRRWEIESIN